MKRTPIKIMAVIIALVFISACCAPAYAATDRERAQSLLDRVDPKDIKVLEDTKPDIARTAGWMFRGSMRDTIDSDVSDEALANLTLSEPIPMFTDLRNAYATDEKGVKRESEFLLFCYADGKTIGYVITRKGSSVMRAGESDAKHLERVIDQLGGEVAGVFSVEYNSYFIGMDGKIAVVADKLYPPVTIDQMETAMDKSAKNLAEYYAQHPDSGVLLGGPDVERVFDILFSNPDTSASGASKAVMYVALPLLVIFFAAMIVLYAKSSKKPRAAGK